MSATELLAAVRAAGVVVAVEGDTIMLRGPASSLTPELRTRLKEAKQEIVSLLTTEPDTCEPRREWAAVYKRLRPLAFDAPDRLTARVSRLWPDIANTIASAETEAEEAARRALAGEAAAVPVFRAAIVRWEAGWRTAFERLANGCATCGQPARVGVIDEHNTRHCSRCWNGR